MAGNYAQLLDIINNPTDHLLPAWDNNAKQIEGETIKQYLLYIINSLTVGYQFMGVATPSTTPGTPDQNVFYIGGAGSYSNFGTSITVRQGQICVFKWNGSWTNTPIEIANSGFVNVNDVNGRSTAYGSASAARSAVPTAYRKSGLNITYLLSTGWVIEQFIGDDVDDWAVADNWKTIGPVRATQNTSTGHTDIEVGGVTTPVASAGEVEIQQDGIDILFDGEKQINDFLLNQSLFGGGIVSTLSGYVSTNFLPVFNKCDYNFGDNELDFDFVYGACYDEHKTFISLVSVAGKKVTYQQIINVSQNAKYVRFTFGVKSSDVQESDISDFVLSIVNSVNYQQEIDEQKKELINLTFKTVGTKSANNFLLNKCLDGGGSVEGFDGYASTPKLLIDGPNNYTFGQNELNFKMIYCALYAQNQTFLGFLFSDARKTSFTYQEIIAAQPTAKYLVISFGSVNRAMTESDIEDWQLTVINQDSIKYQFDAQQNLNQWEGKKMLIMGASGTTIGGDTSWPKLTAVKLEMATPMQMNNRRCSNKYENGQLTICGISATIEEFESIGADPSSSWENYFDNTYDLALFGEFAMESYSEVSVEIDGHIYYGGEELIDMIVYPSATYNNNPHLTYSDGSTLESHRNSYIGAIIYLLDKLWSINPTCRVVFTDDFLQYNSYGQINDIRNGVHKLCEKLCMPNIQMYKKLYWLGYTCGNGVADDNNPNVFLYDGQHPSLAGRTIISNIFTHELLLIS